MTPLCVHVSGSAWRDAYGDRIVLVLGHRARLSGIFLL